MIESRKENLKFSIPGSRFLILMHDWGFSRVWSRVFVTFFLGGLASLAMSPLLIFPALLFSLWGMLWILNHEIERHSSFAKIFIIGWCFGFGYFTIGLCRVPHALVENLGNLWYIVPVILFSLSAYFALFTGLVFGTTALWPFQGPSRDIAFCAFWIGSEWLRAYLFTGFPWNFLGHGWAFSLEMMQIASFAGVYGLSLITLLLVIAFEYWRRGSLFEKRIAFGILLIIGMCWAFGKYRLSHLELRPILPFAIRLVQPNLQPSQYKTHEAKEASFQTLLKMTTQPSRLPLKAVIWPEAAVAFFLELDTWSRLLIAKALPPKALLFTGALRRTKPEETPFKLWNSLLILNDRGEIITHRDKSHLVPFGEYIPLREFIDSLFGKNIIRAFTHSHDMTAGDGPPVLSLPQGIPSCTGLICYEAIFPHAVQTSNQKRPDWILNVSNDSWYSTVSIPYQHLENVRFRAIEQGIPLVRVANTGISAVFDAYGHMLEMMPLNQNGILDVYLPAPIPHTPLYGRWGDWLTLCLVSSVLIIALLVAARSSVRKSRDQ